MIRTLIHKKVFLKKISTAIFSLTRKLRIKEQFSYSDFRNMIHDVFY